MNISKITFALCITGIAVTSSVMAGDTFTKEWKKEYTINADAAFKLKSEFSDINITTWEKKTIQVFFLVEVEAKNQEQADKVLKGISVEEISASSSLVDLQTQFKQKDLDDVEISYTIKLPNTVRIDLENDFGSTFLATMKAPATINIAYGSLRAETLQAKGNLLNLDFGSAEIDAFVEGDINLSYSSLEIDRAGVIELGSSFSAIDFDEIGVLVSKTSYDGFEIDKAGVIELSGSFSSFEIDELSKRLRVEVDYGSIEVDNILKDFEWIDAKAAFSSIELEFESGASYALDARAEAGEIGGPSNIDAEVKIHADHMTQSLKGTVGSSPGSRTVVVKVAQGNIEID